MTKTYSLSSMHKLVDLNGDLTNFDLAFTVKSKDGSEFEGVVVDQKMLDSGDPIKYRKAPGSLSGNIVSDKGIYQNFFLVLRSVNECECDVSIDIKEIPAKEPDPTPIQPSVQQEKAPVENLGKALSSVKSPKSGDYNWKLIIIFLIVLGAGGYIFYIYSQKKKDANSNTNTNDANAKSVMPAPSSPLAVPPTSNGFPLGGSQGGSLGFAPSPPSQSLTDRAHRLQPTY
jgi:hypothetical protein